MGLDKIWVFGEANGDDVASITLEMLAAARDLADTVEVFMAGDGDDYAEELGLADRIFLVMGSDFGRTNFINEGNGKDHWPIGSYAMMERGALWGDRVIGQTDELHFARGIDPATLKVKSNGLIMTPSHIHKAVQEYLGIDGFASDVDFGLANTESLPLFDPFIGSTT